MLVKTTVLLLALLLLSSVRPDDEVLRSLDTTPVLHFTLNRRGGPFSSVLSPSDHVNLTYLEEELDRTEARFNLTKREVKGNKLVRTPKTTASGGNEESRLMGEVATNGTWYGRMMVGDPPQALEVDLNMLVSDFHIVTTTSRSGNRYDDFFSKSHIKKNELLYRTCSLPTDLFHLPTINATTRLSFAYCRPSKASKDTLGPSGSILGLAPSEHLSQTGATSILKQLVDKESIHRPIFSLMLINNREGVLSIGGTAANAVNHVETETRTNLDRIGGKASEAERPLQNEMKLAKRSRTDIEVDSRDTLWEKEWSWSKTQGADGWWQILMQSVWVDGTKALKNQAVVIDASLPTMSLISNNLADMKKINTPFILAPPLAAKAFYASLSGSFQLPPPQSSFYAFPCLNPPKIAFEFQNKKYPFMHSPRQQLYERRGENLGGRFSLGRLRPGSGYCVGSVVETRMGLKDEKAEVLDGGRRGMRLAAERGNIGGNGMRDIWVIGEGFFRAVGGVFDVGPAPKGSRCSNDTDDPRA